jgi:tetratricopeptide (TPR) repeat protein
MKRRWIAAVLGMAGLGLGALGAAEAAEAAGIAPFYGRLERAIVVRDRGALEDCREVLRREEAPSPLGGSVQRAYTLAFINSRLAPMLPPSRGAERKALLEEAAEALRQAVRLNPRDAEAHALLGAVYGAQVSGSRLKGMTQGPKISAAFKEAERLAPNNPRVALQKGISLFYVPKAFGGGPEAAERELRRAEALFAREPAGKPWPNWGRVDVHVWLGRALAEKGDRQGARAAYQRALALAPDHAMVRGELLPAVER